MKEDIVCTKAQDTSEMKIPFHIMEVDGKKMKKKERRHFLFYISSHLMYLSVLYAVSHLNEKNKNCTEQNEEEKKKQFRTSSHFLMWNILFFGVSFFLFLFFACFVVVFMFDSVEFLKHITYQYIDHMNWKTERAKIQRKGEKSNNNNNEQKFKKYRKRAMYETMKD